jgi:hypothetical protein
MIHRTETKDVFPARIAARRGLLPEGCWRYIKEESLTLASGAFTKHKVRALRYCTWILAPFGHY